MRITNFSLIGILHLEKKSFVLLKIYIYIFNTHQRQQKLLVGVCVCVCVCVWGGGAECTTTILKW
jgi:hypothetical protein